jgi:predicted GH43/DUF377 family glycosyl hydrolase
LTFQSGTIRADGSLTVDPTARLASVPTVRSRTASPSGDDVELDFRADEDLSERVIFPVTDAQSNGIEDARFVQFNDGGRSTFYATYTAYSGRTIRSELLETNDILKVRMTREPLVRPEPAQREGYVPNIVYTSGAMRHGDRIIPPYAISDTFSDFAAIKITDLMDAVLD